MTANEQRLALALGAVLLGGGAFIGLTKLKTWKLSVDTHAMEVETRRVEAENLLGQKEFWNERSQWLSEKLPPFTASGEVTETLLTRLQELAGKHGVRIQPQPTDSSERPGLTSVNMTINAQGEMKPLLQWLYEVQQPSEFINITSLVLALNDEKGTEMNAVLSLQKWFRLPSS